MATNQTAAAQRPIRTEPFAPWPHFSADEIEATTRVLQSGKVNYWTGTEGRRFEAEYAARLGCAYGVAVANGTVALELALEAVGVEPGDEVIVTSRTFIASASAVVMRGAIPVMADVDPDSQNITADTIAAVLTPKTRAIICVHLAGWPCDMDSINALAESRGLWVIEDCAQAHEATYKGKPVGSLGHVAAFSFCQDKILTTGGEGGMLFTNDERIWQRAWAFKDHGKSYDTVYNTSHPPGFRWLHESWGTNWRMTEMQSAIGRVLLGKLARWVSTRRRHAAILTDRLGALEALRVPVPRDDIHHSYYKFYAFVRPERLRAGWDRDRIMNAVVAQGVPCYSGSCSEIYREKAFATSGMQPAQPLPVARRLGETSLMFLVHPTLSERDMDDVASVVESVAREAICS